MDLVAEHIVGALTGVVLMQGYRDATPLDGVQFNPAGHELGPSVHCGKIGGEPVGVDLGISVCGEQNTVLREG